MVTGIGSGAGSVPGKDSGGFGQGSPQRENNNKYRHGDSEHEQSDRDN